MVWQRDVAHLHSAVTLQERAFTFEPSKCFFVSLRFCIPEPLFSTEPVRWLPNADSYPKSLCLLSREECLTDLMLKQTNKKRTDKIECSRNRINYEYTQNLISLLFFSLHLRNLNKFLFWANKHRRVSDQHTGKHMERQWPVPTIGESFIH